MHTLLAFTLLLIPLGLPLLTRVTPLQHEEKLPGFLVPVSLEEVNQDLIVRVTLGDVALQQCLDLVLIFVWVNQAAHVLDNAVQRAITPAAIRAQQLQSVTLEKVTEELVVDTVDNVPGAVRQQRVDFFRWVEVIFQERSNQVLGNHTLTTMAEGGGFEPPQV